MTLAFEMLSMAVAGEAKGEDCYSPEKHIIDLPDTDRMCYAVAWNLQNQIVSYTLTAIGTCKAAM